MKYFFCFQTPPQLPRHPHHRLMTFGASGKGPLSLSVLLRRLRWIIILGSSIQPGPEDFWRRHEQLFPRVANARKWLCQPTHQIGVERLFSRSGNVDRETLLRNDVIGSVRNLSTQSYAQTSISNISISSKLNSSIFLSKVFFFNRIFFL